jgi:GH25 family lysozyme M1 (1,4-beta-N-acetylmuramidase)
MNQHSNAAGATTTEQAPAAPASRARSFSSNGTLATSGGAQANAQTFAASSLTMMSFTIGDKSVPRTDVVDVASYQYWLTQANFNTLRSLGVRGAVVKTSEGNFYQNPYAGKQIQYAKNAGMAISVYHYVHFSSQAAAINEANYFANTLDALNVGKQTNVVADVEDNDVVGRCWRESNCVLADLEQSWLQ